jgi:SAM-dependent methyltransferase
MRRTSAEEHARLVAGIEDPALRAPFTYRFLVAAEIFDELADAAAWRMLADAGLLPGGDGASPQALAAERGLPDRARVPLKYLFAKLTHAGALEERGGLHFPSGAPPADFGEKARELAEAVPEAAVGADVLHVLVDEAPAFFRGEKTGEEILFSPVRLPLWFRYFSNANVLYAVNNALGAEALARAAPAGAEVLEIGGGAGSAAEAALALLDGRVARYRFTELVPTFARRGERAARAAASPATLVEGGRLDMTKPWEEQGVAPSSFDVVYAVNCFHVAPDLGFVLSEARKALKTGGAVVVSECVRPTGSTVPIYVELIFDFLESFTNVRTDPALRPTHGFLSPRDWRASFQAAGLPRVEVLPDVDAVARRYPRFFVGALVARGAEGGC